MKCASIVILLSLIGVARAQVLEVQTVGTSGKPVEALPTPDGKYVLVTVNQPGASSGIDVFELNGEKLKRVKTQPLGSSMAQGLVLVPGTRMLAVGLSDAGVGFLRLDDALLGKAKVGVLAQGAGSGSGYLAATPDGKTLFVANEYGDGGNIGVIALHADAEGDLHPELTAHLRTPRTTPGVSISPDGTRLYAVSEAVAPQIAQKLPGHGVPELQRSGCMQGPRSRPVPNGVLYVFDVAKVRGLKLEHTPEDERAARVAMVNAGCSPVRSDVTAAGKEVYLSARGDDWVLDFDADKLESDPEHALIRGFASGGAAPVGLRLFDGGKMLLVANSNRFGGGVGSAAVFNLEGVRADLRQTIRTGEFPRNIAVSADQSTLFLTIFNGNELMVLHKR